jgi:hypothetical protein
MTVLDAIIQSLSRAGEYDRDERVAPAGVLWPDKDRRWEPLLPMVRERLPRLPTLGRYAANCKTGPAIWVRWVIHREGKGAGEPFCEAPELGAGRTGPGPAGGRFQASVPVSDQVKSCG